MSKAHDKQQDPPGDPRKQMLGWTVLSVSAISLIFLLFHVLDKWLYPNIQDRAAFGDSFGALNSLFTGLAFGGLILTVILQMRELALQRYELVQSRHAQQQMAEATRAEIAQISIDLFHKFLSEHFYNIRARSWEVRSKWYSSLEYRQELLELLLPLTLEQAEKSPKSEEIRQDRIGLVNVLEFYSLLSHYAEARETMIKCQYFYFDTWRGFLLWVCDEFEARYNKLSVVQQKQMPSQLWFENIRILDTLLGLPAYDEFAHPLDRFFAQNQLARSIQEAEER